MFMVSIVLALVRFMVTDRASNGCAYNAVVTRDMARCAAHHCTFDAAFGVRRINGCQANRYCYARTYNECFHFGLRSLARFNHACLSRSAARSRGNG
jgi:hypothetical protein